MLGGTEQRNLGANQRSVGGVERDQPILARITAGVPVGVHERVGKTIPTPGGQVHHQERDIVGNIELAQRAVELDAVDHLKRLVEEHMLGAEVAMPLAHESASCAGVQHLRVRRHERVREALQGKNPSDLGPLLDDPQQLVEVLRHPPLHGQDWHPTRRDSPRARVKLRQHASQRDDLAALELAALELRRQRAALVVPAHLDQIVDRARIVLFGQFQSVGCRGERAHTEIQIGRQPTVQPHLLAAHLVAPLGRAVVQEREHQGLLELVGEIAGEKHPRDVRLADLHPGRPVGIEIRPGERGANIAGFHRGYTWFGAGQDDRTDLARITGARPVVRSRAPVTSGSSCRSVTLIRATLEADPRWRIGASHRNRSVRTTGAILR